jgi:hypothetical protein
MKYPCPNLKQHVKGEPSGYIAWHEWAERKAKTHRQERCPGCGLFVIWKPKQEGEA